MKKMLGLMLCALVALSYGFVSCSNDDDNTPTVESVSAVETSGTVTVTAATNTDGAQTATLRTKDGAYTFTEDTENATPSANILARAADSTTKSGKWTFTETGKLTPKYSGTYTGDISQLNNESTKVELRLTVEKFQTDSGETVNANEATFTLTVETNTETKTLTATIPAVTEKAYNASEDAGKSDADLIKEANTALSDGDYKTAVAKFRAAYDKNPSDANKIYYVLTELATLSTDDDIVSIIRNNLGFKDYPASLNAIFNTDWLKDTNASPLGDGWLKAYPEYEEVKVYHPTQSATGDYIRVSGTPTNTYANNTYPYPAYALYDGDWLRFWNYRDITNEGAYLTDVTPNANGTYLVDFSTYYKIEYSTHANVSYTSDAQEAAKTKVADYLYDVSWSDATSKAILGEILYVPGLTTPTWATSQEYYKGSLIGTTQTYKTWLYLLYANIVTNNEAGFNGAIDKLVSAFDKKTATIKTVVDAMGTEKATLDADLLATLNLTEVLGEDPCEIGKAEMNVLVSALEGIDAVLNFVASYDLSANLKAAQVDWNKTEDEVITIVNDCITAKTLASRDAAKLTASKTLFTDALTRLIASYDSIKDDTSYPQAFKNALAENGTFLREGAEKIKNAITDGTVVYFPESASAKTYPNSAEEAAFGIDFGKLFTAGYFTDIIARSSDKETVKIYYQKITESYSSSTGYEKEKSAVTELTRNLADVVADAGETYDNGSYTEIYYKVGIMVNSKIIADLLPGLVDSTNGKHFVPLVTID